MQQTINTNILILGKTGVGKSSFLNYLFGKDIAEAGNSRPVTGCDIHKYEPFLYNEIHITLYDSFGLEPDKADLWKEKILKEAQENNKEELKDWFHTIVYCIDAQASRITDFEFDSILLPMFEAGNKICFVFTKTDLAKQEEIIGLKNSLAQKIDNPSIAEVCSIFKKLRNGRISAPFGKDQFYEIMLGNLTENIIHKTLEKFIIKVIHNYDDFSDIIYDKFCNTESMFRSQSSTKEIMQEHFEYEFKKMHENNIHYLNSGLLMATYFLRTIQDSFIHEAHSIAQRTLESDFDIDIQLLDENDFFAHPLFETLVNFGLGFSLIGLIFLDKLNIGGKANVAKMDEKHQEIRDTYLDNFVFPTCEQICKNFNVSY